MNDRSTPQVHLHIGGEQRTTGSGGSHSHMYPADGSSTGMVPLAGAEETNEAVAAAATAFVTWRRRDPRERARMLRRLGELVRENANEFGRLGALDNGTPVLSSTFAASIAADWIDYYAGWADRIEGQINGIVRSAGNWAIRSPNPMA